MSALTLYRRSPFRATLFILLLSALAISFLAAQRRSPHKLRATALLELSTDPQGVKTARLTPIVILDDGNFHDASIYKTEPQPMALESGVVYEAEKAGDPVGFVTVSSAAKDAGMWTGLGKWQAQSDRPKPQPSAAPVQSASDDRPRLHRSGSSEGESSPTPSPSSSTSPQSSGSDDRPVLRRPASDSQGAATPTPSPGTTSTSSSSTPTATPAVTPEEESHSIDPNRPTLRRGKPAPTPVQAENAAQPAATPASVSATKSPAKTAKSSSSPAPGTQLMVAVSDAEPGDSRSFQFPWKPGEEAPINAKLRHQAAQRLSQEIAAHGGAEITERELKNVAIRSFDLDLTNDAILVLTAELPPGSAGPTVRTPLKTKSSKKAISQESSALPPSAAGPTHYITLIARVDLDGNPQVLAANLTDSSRLDVASRLELVDAVDVDGDGIAELLFREYDFDNQQFVIYRIRHGTVTKLFEGASQPIK